MQFLLVRNSAPPNGSGRYFVCRWHILDGFGWDGLVGIRISVSGGGLCLPKQSNPVLSGEIAIHYGRCSAFECECQGVSQWWRGDSALMIFAMLNEK